MQQFIMEAKAMQEELVSYRRHIHQSPETGLELPNTVAFVKGKLEELGYEVTECAGGLVTTVGGKKPGKVVMLRADMDALPITEEADVEFKSVNGSMHACGHDLHTTMLLGAAKILKNHEDELEGTVKLMFQPGEEVLLGAKAMVEAGVLENPAVDAAYMFHVVSGMPAPAGLLVIPGEGAFSAGSDRFEITIKGKGGHGAMPEQAIDPLNVAAHTYIALQSILARETASAENAMITVGQMEGGKANNVVPDIAIMKGTIRTFSEETRTFIFKRIEEIAKGTAATFRAEAEVKIVEGAPSVINDKAVISTGKEVLTETFSPQVVHDLEKFGMTKLSGSEDFAFVTKEVPSAMLLITAGNSQEGYPYPIHHPKAKFDESALCMGAAAYATLGYDWLKKNAE